MLVEDLATHHGFLLAATMESKFFGRTYTDICLRPSILAPCAHVVALSLEYHALVSVTPWLSAPVIRRTRVRAKRQQFSRLSILLGGRPSCPRVSSDDIDWVILNRPLCFGVTGAKRFHNWPSGVDASREGLIRKCASFHRKSVLGMTWR